jgi:hypothetical protein
MKTLLVVAIVFFICLSIWDGYKHAMSSGTMVDEENE